MSDLWAVKGRLDGRTDHSWLWGGADIHGVGETPPVEALAFGVKGSVISVPLCDTHTHGAMGLGVVGEPDGLEMLLDLYASHGVGSLQLSTVTLPPSDLRAVLEAARDVAGRRGELIGVHLEGPFLSHEKKGAHDPTLLQTGTLVAVRDLIEPFLDVVSSVTIDPVSTEMAAVEWMVAHGVIVSIGHTPATYVQALDYFHAGATVLTHAFNAMLPISSREPGPVMAAIDAGAWIEVIADGHHVHPSIVTNLFDLVPEKVVLVSDSMFAAGLRDGDYSVGTVPVTMVGGIARTKDGSLAGSTLSLADAVTNVVSWGVDPVAALAAATVNPRAAYRQDIPLPAAGSPADFILWSNDTRLTHIVRGGVVSPVAAA